MDIKIKDAIKQCRATLICGDLELVLDNFCKDTREIKNGDVYIGINGTNFNGSLYFKDAFDKGAKACIVDNVEISKEDLRIYGDKAIIKVENTIDAIQKLAKYKRNLYDIPVVAITGSVGKTSTKDIVANVIGQKYKVLKTEGNYNNHIGMPLTILRLKDHEAIVLEMGMNHLGEISLLSKIANPTIGIITNVGTAHIGNLGSRENILKAKLELLDGMDKNSKLIINNDNDMLHDYYLNNNRENILTYGINNKSDIVALNTRLEENGSIYNVELDSKEFEIQVQIGGKHFVENSLCAITLGKHLNISMNKITKGIKTFELTKKRMQIEKINNNVIINDAYNANYDSMKAAIEYLARSKADKKVALLGDMFELGKFSDGLHRKVGEEIVKNNIDTLITVGKQAKLIAKQAIEDGMDKEEICILDTNEQAIVKTKEILKNENITILIKASNGMNFEEIVKKLDKKKG